VSRRYDNRGRDQIPIENVHGDVYVGEARSRKRPDREMTWLKAFEKEIEGRLASSLHNRVLIKLGKETQPEQVHRLWDMEVKSGQITEMISPQTEISEVFDRPEIAGKLLILGKPGAGKTTTLLELARALVRRAIDDPSEPIPFLLNLSSWKDPNQSIKDWAIAELTTKGIGSKIGSKWFEDQKMLPLLDGLDEVRSDRQSVCVKAINHWMSGEGQPSAIVVCSRREEYELYPERLNLHGAIYLQELSDRQIESYLHEIDRASLWQVLEADAALLDLVRQPLLLSITLVAYRKELAEQWEGCRSTQERLTFLLDAYIEKMLYRQSKSRFYGDKELTVQQTQQWLVRLAHQLQNDNETEFLIEKMQPAWLRGSCQEWIYRLILGQTYGLFFGLIVGASTGLVYGIIAGLTNGVTVGISRGLIAWLGMGLIFSVIDRSTHIEPIETIKISVSTRSRREVASHLIAGLIGGLLGGVILGTILGMTDGLMGGLMYGLSNGLITGMIKASKTEITTRTRPNQGIFSSAKNVVTVMSLSLVAALGIIAFLFLLFSQLLWQNASIPLLIGYLGCLIFLSFFTGGGHACIQHFSLRLVLFFSRAIPWNYARFLNYATDRMFLQRIGGRYRFIHKLLQDHFAQMEE
jgi:DNA polymerase III delta prime subunit